MNLYPAKKKNEILSFAEKINGMVDHCSNMWNEEDWEI